tara:strand:+ start:2097 stop:3128 length:1032 start_codon:yes stop_codon:yes gene_type:complete
MTKNNINVVVAGATGFVGLDLVYLLSKHPNIKITNLCAQKNIGKKINKFDKRIKKKLPKISKIKSVNWNKIDLLFLSLPNGEAQKLIKKLYYKYTNLRFIDLSADFRIENSIKYKNSYNMRHKAKKLIKKSIYSVSELKKNKINNFRIIANPGCYPTSIQIPLIPLLKKKLINNKNITIDSKSGYSGAGKNYKSKFKFKNFYLATYAYGVKSHRHISEIDQELKKISKNVLYTFNPHLIPSFRGILSSIYINKKKNVTVNKIVNTLKLFYKKDHFINIYKPNAELGTGNVIGTNNCNISICQTRFKNKIVIFSAIDNLIKGAAGQAIQNMNILYKFKETSGLK